ncbi:MAG: glycine--tRNA ligase [Bacteroidia bacterium]
MAQQEDPLRNITSHCKEYGFIFPSSEIYDGLAAIYDYGQNGVELKRNLRDYWWKAMVQMNENIVGLDSAIFMHPKTWKASGHVDNFNDPMIDNKDSKKRYRADELIETKIAQYEKKGKTQKAGEIRQRMEELLEQGDLKAVKALIEELGIADPVSGSKNWSEVRQFNLMFGTQMGSVAEGSDAVWLRPETAQGIFVNFLNVQKTGRMKLPFGIAQVGKAFRNEIVARQFLFRMREFEQMEMQFFVRPGTEMEWFEYWKEKRMNWHLSLGLDKSKYRIHEHIKLAHYANAAVDIEYEFPIGFKEVEGVHSRTDFDLKQHQEHSGRKMQYFDPEVNENYIPYVVETSIGLDRMFLLLLSAAYTEEDLGEGSSRVVLKLPPVLAPVKVGILPLLRKDGLPEKAREIFDTMKYRWRCQYEEKDTIGKRYRRHDAIGTPYCITIDHDTLQDDSVTVRYRDTMEQKRVAVGELMQMMEKELDEAALLRKI